jgi:response regulator RpfG family c-di-GMP phosphodiesterase
VSTAATATGSLRVPARPRVLCVDDEPRVLDGLSLTLRRFYQVTTAASGPAALEILEREPGFTVVLSDMRMPAMDGATLLARVRALAPDATRLLLTGETDIAGAILAVNEGQIFRFLTKPCPPQTLIAAMDAAWEQHRLVTAEKELLEQTLRGAVQALTDVLALTSPAAFGRAQRIQRNATDIAVRIGLADRWQVEVAAMLSQLGYVTLPPEVVERAYEGAPLSEADQQLVARVPAATDRLVANIPRLEGVRAILSSCSRRNAGVVPGHASPGVEIGSRILAVALEYDALETAGCEPHVAIDRLRARHTFDPACVTALAEARAAAEVAQIRDVPLAGLLPGMTLVDDVKTVAGMLLIARGLEVTDTFLERVRHFRPGTVREPVRVIVRSRL